MSRRIKIILSITLSLVLAVLLVLAALTYIPLTHSTDYHMTGYIISPDGNILESFVFEINCTEYNFVIDPPGGGISFSGNELTKLREDAFVLRFDWGSSSLASKCMYGHMTDSFFPTDTQMFGMMSYYNAITNRSHFDSGIFDTERGTFCMYSNVLADQGFIVGVTDPNTDLQKVVDTYLKVANIPELEGSDKK